MPKKRKRSKPLLTQVFWVMLLWGSFSFFLAKCGHRAFEYARRWYEPNMPNRHHHNLSGFGVRPPEGYQVYGLDISHHQGVVNWKELSQMETGGLRMRFVFMKATEGRDIQDRLFAYNWRESRRQGLYRGAYHFYRPNTKSTYQAENFIRTVKLEKGDLPPVLDIEITGKYSTENMRQGLRKWLRIVEEHYQVKPIIYTNYNFYYNYLKGHIEGYPLWIARYGKEQLNLRAGDNWTFWQYSDRGTLNGTSGYVDMNVFKGSIIELKALCKSSTDPR